MAVIRTSELRSMTEKELSAKLTEIEKEITSQNAKLAAGGMADNPGKLAEMKKIVARIKTISKEKKIRYE
jgi:large subunit ribosomal protein L29